MDIESQSSALYNYLYNFILKQPDYICEQNYRELSDHANVNYKDVSKMIHYLKHNKMIVTKEDRIMLPYTLDKLDQLHHELDNNFNPNPNDYLRRAYIIMRQNMIEIIDKDQHLYQINGKHSLSPYEINVLNNIHDMIAKRYLDRIFGQIVTHINVQTVGLVVSCGKHLTLNLQINHSGIDNPDHKYFVLLEFDLKADNENMFNHSLSRLMTDMFPDN